MTDVCPHCGHEWANHKEVRTFRHGEDHREGRCDCGCMWPDPAKAPKPPPPPTARDQLIATIADTIWAGFEADENCYADREMDVIDTGGSYTTFSMAAIAAGVLARLESLDVIGDQG